MMQLSDPLMVTLQVIDVFDELHIPYLLGGSMASALYGTARSTLDTDLVAQLRKEQVPFLVKKLEDTFYIDEEMILDAISFQGSFNIIHLETMFKVDVFIARQRLFDQRQFQRRHLQIVSDNPERKIYVSTAEDIILAKLEWYLIGGKVSERQWHDILGVLKVQGSNLDISYLENWAKVLKVDSLLQQALDEIK